MLGLSQEKLGKALDLTFQQVQKYERGANRVGASRLFELAGILDVPVSFFFDAMPDEVRESGGARVTSFDETRARASVAQYGTRQSLELVRNFLALTDDVQKGVYDLVKRLARHEQGPASTAHSKAA